MATRKIEVAITGDSRTLERAFARSGKAADSFGKRLSGGATRSLASLARVGAAASVVIGVGAVYGMKKAVDAASDLQESISKTNVVFGKNAKQVMAWSKTSVTAMGQSQQQALEAASTYGNLFQAFGVGLKPATKMSTTLTQLASDLASFNNTSVDEAIEALRSGLSGETEPLKRYGIAINDARLKNEALKLGLISTTKDALSPAAKAQAAYALVMKDSQLAQGDFARTSDGLANSQRILRASFENVKATLGTTLIPIVTRAMNLVGDFLDEFNRAPTLRAKVSVIVDAFQGIAWAGWRTIADWWNGTQKPLDLLIRPKLESGRELTIRILDTYSDSVTAAAGKLGTKFARSFSDGAADSGSDIPGRLMVAWFRESNPFTNTAIRAAAAFVKDFLTEITRGIRDGIQEAIRMGLDVATGGVKGFVGRFTGAMPGGSGTPSPQGKRGGQRDAEGYVAAFRLYVDQYGYAMFRGMTKGGKQAANVLKASIKQAVEDSVRSARANLGSLTSGLAGMLNRRQDARIAGMTSAGELTGGKTLAQIRSEQARVNREREEARLRNAVSEAKTDEERQQATQDLNDWLIEEEARKLEENMEQSRKAYDEDIANLQDSFDRGIIDATTFKTELQKIIGAETGTVLGESFATAWQQQLTAILSQIDVLAGYAGVGLGAPTVENPAAAGTNAAKEANRQRYKAALEKWEGEVKDLKDRLADARSDLKKAEKDDDQKAAASARRRIDRLNNALATKNAEKPKRADFGLAKGGVLKQQVFTAGEGGPEAVIPLDSGRAKRLLAEAVGSGATSGRATIINVTVNGNEFSARDFARKLQPELNRLVGFGTV